MQPEAVTTHGRVRGERRDGVARFLGVPYAAPPVGARRFAAPEPPQPWDGVRDATAFGPTPPAAGYQAPFDTILTSTQVPGDDWLTVNVWTPDPGAAGLPVMVWIHGGAFVNGSSAVATYGGQAFARDGVVLVTLNYRLGVEGFAALPDAPANRGLLDQLAALEWVRDNAAAFGGHPARVTVFGESAGAMSITTLLGLPQATGLFAQAITQSGAAQAAADPADAALVTRELGTALGLDDVRATTLADVDPARLLAAQRRVSQALTTGPDPVRFGASVVAGLMAFVPVVDGDVVPVHPQAALAAGASADVPLLTGTTTEEFRFFLAPPGITASLPAAALPMVLAAQGVPASVVDVYRAHRPDASPGDLLAAIVTDRYFRAPSIAVVEARPRDRSWVYELAWRSPRLGLGAAHAVDVPFVFDALAAEGTAGLLGDDPPQALADRVHCAWVAFATDGDPGWAPYGDDRAVHVFDEPADRLVHAPRDDERALWAG
ncbi:carboxylesterase/lipase family protein [Angustibacter aerolatus]